MAADPNTIANEFVKYNAINLTLTLTAAVLIKFESCLDSTMPLSMPVDRA